MTNLRVAFLGIGARVMNTRIREVKGSLIETHLPFTEPYSSFGASQISSLLRALLTLAHTDNNDKSILIVTIVIAIHVISTRC